MDEFKKDTRTIGGEENNSQKLEWGKYSVDEAVKLFQEVIPVGCSKVSKEKALFVDGIVVNHEKEEVLFVTSKLDVSDGGKKKMIIGWSNDLLRQKNEALPYEKEVIMARQKNEGQRDAILIAENGKYEGKKAQLIRKFQPC